jgi:serine/threonine protein kinase
LPAALSQDPERLARFEREAKVLASLNHPNIATIRGVEESDGVRALVMELVPGESLKGPLPLKTALNYAKQIADALEAAHDPCEPDHRQGRHELFHFSLPFQ